MCTSTNAYLDRQTEIITAILKACREEFHEDIQSFEQLHVFSMEHPEKNERLVSLITESGYLDLWKEEEKLNGYNFDADLFIEKYKGNAMQAVVLNRRALNQCEGRYKSNLLALLIETDINGDNLYLSCMIKLYQDLVEQCERRRRVLADVEDKIQQGSAYQL